MVTSFNNIELVSFIKDNFSFFSLSLLISSLRISNIFGINSFMRISLGVSLVLLNFNGIPYIIPKLVRITIGVFSPTDMFFNSPDFKKSID